MNATRQEHMKWCKERALEYCDNGDGAQAIASMLSDLRKHPETAPSAGLGATLMLTVNRGDMASVRRFIEGFN